MKKAAIIGCGGISQVHLRAIAGMEEAELAVLCDVDEEKALRRREEYLRERTGEIVNDRSPAEEMDKKPKDTQELNPERKQAGMSEGGSDKHKVPSGIKICTDWHELCGMDIDVVHICTPHYLHVPMAVELMNAGKAVFMEKPCAVSTEQFEELAAADARHPGKLGICFQNRYNETTRIIDKTIAEGRIGKVTGGRAFVTWRRDEDYYRCSAWKGRLATEGGGALINQSIHTLDLLLRYLGEPVEIKATLANHHLQRNTGCGSDYENGRDHVSGAKIVFGAADCVLEDVCPEDTHNKHEEKPDFDRIEVEDTVEAWMEFENGARACFYASTGYAADAPVILELQGDKGRISMNGSTVFLENEEDGFLILASDIPVKGVAENLQAGSTAQIASDKSAGVIRVRQTKGEDCQQIGQHPCTIKDYWGSGHKACIEDFYRCLTTGDPFPVNLKGAENSFRTMMKIYAYRR
ncbi:MAG: Gfo/Idh/MocA family oxidoreductase [Lachnospiraceae bacterium]|nr:Gfo/Idh/MocA family oxidoreductase [Lachnospiraceae bacterium]